MSVRTEDNTDTPATAATKTTRALHRKITAQLPLEDRSDFDFAARGFLGTIAPARITGQSDEVIWDLEAYDFLASLFHGTAPNGSERQLVG